MDQWGEKYTCARNKIMALNNNCKVNISLKICIHYDVAYISSDGNTELYFSMIFNN